MSLFRNVLFSTVFAALAVFGLVAWHTQQMNDFTILRGATHIVSNGPATCSGVTISKNIVLTAAHCQQDSKSPMRVDGLNAEIVKRDTDVDLMVLKVLIPCPCVPVALTQPPVDTKVVATGYPLADHSITANQWLTEGRLQEVQRVKEINFTVGVTSPGIFGNSGGPIYAFTDGGWKVVGIYSMLRGGALMGMFPYVVPHMGLAVSTDTINKFLKPK